MFTCQTKEKDWPEKTRQNKKYRRICCVTWKTDIRIRNIRTSVCWYYYTNNNCSELLKCHRINQTSKTVQIHICYLADSSNIHLWPLSLTNTETNVSISERKPSRRLGSVLRAKWIGITEFRWLESTHNTTNSVLHTLRLLPTGMRRTVWNTEFWWLPVNCTIEILMLVDKLQKNPSRGAVMVQERWDQFKPAVLCWCWY